MLTNSPLYASFAVNDIPAAKQFYADTLGVRVVQIDEGLLSIQAYNGYAVLAYVKPEHVPAEHTIVNFPVDDIETTVDRLTEAGVTF
jgi:predicted enzyme related to lactoylglutathione lyase